MALSRSGVWLAIFLTLASMLGACGTPIEDDRDTAPGRDELIANFRSPTDVDSLRSFRVHGSTEFSEGFIPGDNGLVGVEMWLDVVVDPPAMHMTMKPVTDSAVGDPLFAEEMMVVGNRIWRLDESGGWREVDMGFSNLADWYRDALLNLQEPGTGQTGSMDMRDVLEAAEIVGAEEVNGMRTTHFLLTTPVMLDILNAEYEALQDPALDEECNTLFQDAGGEVGAEPSASDMEQFTRCMGAVFGRDMPPPGEYIDVYEMELWVADDGFIVKQKSNVEQSTATYALLFGVEAPAGPFTTSSSVDLYDFNADITIEPPIE